MSILVEIDPDPVSRFERRQAENRAKREPTEDEIAARESERHAKRQEIRERMAAHELASAEYVRISDSIAAVEAQKDSIAFEHCEACKPIQAELRDIEQQQIKLVASRQPSDKQLEARQAELLEQLRGKNYELSEAIAGKDRLIAQLLKEQREVAERMKDSAARNELITTGRRDLVIAMQVCQREVEFCERRIAVAEDMRPRWNEDFYQAERVAASEALEVAREKSAAAFQAVIDE